MRSDRFVAVLAGLLWGGLGSVLAQPWFRISGWQGVALGLLIGAAVARLHDRIAPQGIGGLVGLSCLTFTLGAAVFGATAQVMTECGWIVSRGPSAPPGSMVELGQAIVRVLVMSLMSIVGVWTLGMFIVLWPLALITHFVYWVASDPEPSSEV